MLRELFALLARIFGSGRTPEDGWSHLMQSREQWEKQLQGRIERLEKEVIDLTLALERERVEHADCRRRISELESTVAALVAKQDARE